MRIRLIHLLTFISIISLLSACQPTSKKWQGYVETEFTYLSSSFSGTLQQLAVERGDNVKPGQLLFVLEEQPEHYQEENAKAKVASAQALLNQSESKLTHSKAVLDRRERLFKTGGIDKESLDTARIDYQVAQQELDRAKSEYSAAQTELQRAKWSKAQKAITATTAAEVYDTYYKVGEFVPAGRAVLSLLNPADIKIIFYVSVADLSKIKLGQTLKLVCDGCEQTVPVKITYISSKSEYTPPVIYSDQNRAKLVYLIEARPISTVPHNLHAGQPISVISQ